MQHSFKIWAPKANELVLVLNNREFVMQKGTEGYWQLDLDLTEKPLNYGFKVDGDGPFPDPGSKAQPHGVHELSQLPDHEFTWHDENFVPRPLAEAVIYELHPGTFTTSGTFTAVIDRLDHLKALGITHIELMPIASFPGRHGWGYDGVSLFAPQAGYGTPDELKTLINACHEKGFALILDVVYNHLGPDGNYLGLYGHYFSGRYRTPWGDAVNFDDAHSDKVREFIIANALYWLREFHFDGLRLDAVHAIYDFSATHILEELQLEVEELARQSGRKLFLIAESDLNDPRLLYSRKQGGYQLAAQWLDDFHHALHVMFTKEQQGYYCDFSGFADLRKCLAQKFVYGGDYSPHRRRKHGRLPTGLDYERFVVSLQNHDQIGNRALGERISHLIEPAQCQIAAALLLLSPFVPMLFQGEEWAASSPFLYFTDHVDKKLAEAVKNGRRKEFPFIEAEVPDPQSEETFLRSKLKWNEISQEPHQEMLAWYRALIRLRNENLDQIRSSLISLGLAADKGLVISYQAGDLVLLANCENSQVKVSAPAKARALLHNKSFSCDGNNLIMPPASVIVFKQTENNFQGVKA